MPRGVVVENFFLGHSVAVYLFSNIFFGSSIPRSANRGSPLSTALLVRVLGPALRLLAPPNPVAHRCREKLSAEYCRKFGARRETDERRCPLLLLVKNLGRALRRWNGLPRVAAEAGA